MANAKHTNFISRYRASVEAILANVEELQSLNREATFLNYAVAITQEDFEGDNDHMTKAELIAAVQSFVAVEAFLAANNNAHYKALYTLKR